MTALALLGWYGGIVAAVCARLIWSAFRGVDITAGRPDPRA